MRKPERRYLTSLHHPLHEWLSIFPLALYLSTYHQISLFHSPSLLFFAKPPDNRATDKRKRRLKIVMAIRGRFISMVKQAVEERIDPWADKHLEKLPAEKVTRHRFIPETQSWVTDVSIIKMETKPFDQGAQRQIYRLKKISQAPTASWTKLDWTKAPNYVAKCYLTKDGSINTENRERTFNDVRLQYAAAHWANVFNLSRPPKHIHVIQCYVLELTSRSGSPVLGCERFVDGHDAYGAGFVKHNSNSGYVEAEEHRATPQAFSAHSFYASAGRLMVVDVQGVGDLYTDPQVYSSNKYRKEGGRGGGGGEGDGIVSFYGEEIREGL
jgi:hypothetical protein